MTTVIGSYGVSGFAVSRVRILLKIPNCFVCLPVCARPSSVRIYEVESLAKHEARNLYPAVLLVRPCKRAKSRPASPILAPHGAPCAREGPVEIGCCANQRQVRKRLGEIAKMPAIIAQLF